MAGAAAEGSPKESYYTFYHHILGIVNAAKRHLCHLLTAESREALGVTLVKPFCQPSELLSVTGEKHRCPLESVGRTSARTKVQRK